MYASDPVKFCQGAKRSESVAKTAHFARTHRRRDEVRLQSALLSRIIKCPIYRYGLFLSSDRICRVPAGLYAGPPLGFRRGWRKGFLNSGEKVQAGPHTATRS
jgi:hypothetical protein